MLNSVKIMLILVMVMGLVGTMVDAKQTTAINTAEGFDIEIPSTINHIKMNTDYKLHTHVVNLSTGYPIVGDDGQDTLASCVVHLYNETGSHSLDAVMVWDDEGDGVGDFALTIDKGNFTQAGEYAYIINCNDSRIGGFVANTFQVNPSGISLDMEDSVANGIVLFLFFGIAVFFLIFARTTEEGGVKLFFNVIGYITLLLCVGTSYIFLQGVQTGLLPMNMVAIFLIGIVFIVIMYYIFINLTKTSLAMMRIKKGFGSEFDNPATF